MARDKVELLVEIIGKDGVTKLLDSAATEALKLERRLKKGSKQSANLASGVKSISAGWVGVIVGLNQGLELFSKLVDAAGALKDKVEETARIRQVEQRFTQKLNVSVQELAEASGFQLTDIGLQKFALQAQQAGVSMDEFKGLLDLALKASAASGKEFEQVFEGIFVDTVVGASDSFLEQIGIVADMGTITEAYAKKHGIAKDAIDKTVQKQAMLNYLLTEGKGKFENVKVDSYITDLNRVEKEIERMTHTASVMFQLATKDALEFFGVISKKGPNSIQRYRDNVAALDKLMARIKSYKFGDQAGELSAEREAQVLRLMEVIGTSARSSELAMKMLFDRIKEEAKALSELGGEMLSQEQKTHAYDQALLMLAKQYGVLDIAEERYTTKARERAGYFNYAKDKVAALNEAYSGLAFTIGNIKLPDSDFERVFGQPDGEYMQKPGARVGLEPIVDVTKRDKARASKARAAYLKRINERKRVEAEVSKLRQENLRKEVALISEELDLIKELEPLARAEHIGYLFAGVTPMAVDTPTGEPQDRKQQIEDAIAQAEAAERLKNTIQGLVAVTEAGTLTSGFRSISDAVMMLGEASDVSHRRLAKLADVAGAIQNTGVQLNMLTDESVKFAKVHDKSAKDYVQLGGAIAGAGLSAAAGFIEGEKQRAAVLAAMEYAHAGAALATGILTGAPNAYVASAIHLANAGLYTAIASGAKISGAGGGSRGAAGGGGAGGSGSQGARRIPQFGQMQPTTAMQPAQVVVNMSGAIVAGANRKKTANDLGDLVQESMAGRR
jgi:hypothetical protein